MGTMSTNSNAMHMHARQRSTDILIQRMSGPPGTCGNMLCKSCWGKDVLSTADAAKDANDVHTKIVGSILWTGSITAAFEKEKSLTVIANTHALRPGRLSYSLMGLPLLDILGRAEIVCWMAESLHPFDIVTNQSFQSLMKTGRLEYYLLSAKTVARDVRQVFVHSYQQVAKMDVESKSQPNKHGSLN